MTAYQIVGPFTLLVTDTPTTLTPSTTTRNPAGNKNISVLKIDNPDTATPTGLTFSLTGPVTTLDADNTTIVAPGGTAIVQVAPAGYTGLVYVRATGSLYVQPVAIIG